MTKIKILDPHIQNKIAAGEVVERPSSVVKELIENSIDANADEIEVFIKESGMKEIRIIDNGEGIESEDVPLVFERHATSKIAIDYDLFQVRSLGFRGEALASIGAVAKVTLETMNQSSSPVKINYEGGSTVSNTPGKERIGTDIQIRELFYNTPARYKYVRSLRTEAGKIIDIIQRMALNYPNIRFRLMIDQKERLSTKGNGNLKEVISDIYGLHIARKAVKIHAESPDFTVEGYIIRPEETRSNRNYINISVNRRHIKDFKLTQSMINGYHTLQPKDKYPIAVINITMDQKLVDVNVHPAKIEVRFSKERELNKLVEETVRHALREEMLIPDVEQAPRKKEKFENEVMDFNDTASPFKESLKDLDQLFERKEAESGSRDTVIQSEDQTNYGIRENSEDDTRQTDDQTKINQNEQKDTVRQDQSSGEADENPFNKTRTVESFKKPSDKRTMRRGGTSGAVNEETKPVEKEKLPYLEIIGQLHGTYIIMQNESGMYLMDQHAAQERIKYEYYYSHIQSDGEGVPLLIPYTFEFPLDDVIVIDEKLTDLRDLGFEIEKSGMKQYMISRYPDWIKAKDPERDIEDLIDFITHAEHFSVNDYREELSIMMSCKQSIKANHYLNRTQMEALLEELNTCASPYTCPHGRPVIIHLTTYEIERMFNRIMK